jgi:predicted ATPase
MTYSSDWARAIALASLRYRSLKLNLVKISFREILAKCRGIRYYYLVLMQQSSVAQWQSGRLLIDWS